MRMVTRAVLGDIALAILGLLTVTSITMAVANQRGALAGSWSDGTFWLADGTIVRATSAEKVREVQAKLGSKIVRAELVSASSPVMSVMVGTSVVALLLSLLVVGLCRGRRDLPSWRWQHGSVLLGLVSGILMAAFGWAYGVGIAWLGFPVLDWSRILGLVRPAWLVIVATCVLAPVAEEIYFRGRLFSLLDGARGRRFATVVTATVFAGLHGLVVYFPAYLVLGLILAHLRVRRGDLLAPIVAHAVTNALGVMIVYATR